MRTLVTGGTGFVGAHLVRALIDAGADVRCLVRAHSDLANLEGLDVEHVVGDLRDAESLEVAVAGCEALYHCAADYRLGAPDPRELYATNVDGTRLLFESAVRAGIRRAVYTSSVGALGLVDGGVADERTPVELEQMIGHYKRSKFLAEREALRWTDELEMVAVHPSTPIGELDRKPTPTGRIVVDYLAGRMPAFVDTGLNLVDVHDVARGHLLAFEKGGVGERYILGHRNLTLHEILGMLSEITGLPPVRWRVPHLLPHLAAWFDAGWSKVSGRAARLPLESVRMARKKMFFDAGKAVRELGLPQSPVEPALERAARWFVGNGYLDDLRDARRRAALERFVSSHADDPTPEDR